MSSELTNKEKAVIEVIKDFTGLNQHIKDNDLDYSDYYQDDKELAVELVEAGCLDKLEADLINLCEDNEVMKEAIREYFAQ